MKTDSRIFIAVFLFLAVVLMGHRAFSVARGAPASKASVKSAVTSIPEVGKHTPLIRVEKNENRQNLMVVYTKVDETRCAFEATSGRPILDEYWLMDGTRYKRVNPMIKNAVKERFELDQAAFKSGRFLVHLKDFHELKSDLGSDPSFEVTAAKNGSGCQTHVVMKLGPSDHDRRISIDSIYADSEKQALPPFRKLKSLTLNGKDVASGEAIHRTYSAN